MNPKLASITGLQLHVRIIVPVLLIDLHRDSGSSALAGTVGRVIV